MLVRFFISSFSSLSHLQMIAVHLKSSYGHLFHLHGFLKRHIHGKRLLLFCGSDSACMLALSDP